jgi:hypothetical protein
VRVQCVEVYRTEAVARGGTVTGQTKGRDGEEEAVPGDTVYNPDGRKAGMALGEAVFKIYEGNEWLAVFRISRNVLQALL